MTISHIARPSSLSSCASVYSLTNNKFPINMAFDPAVVYLVAATIVVATLIIISVFCNGKGSKKESQQRANQNVAARPRENVPPGARARRRPVRRNRMQMANEDSDEDGIPPADEDEAFLDEFDLPEGKIGAKKLRKLQEKAEKRRQREIELQEREEKKEREKKQEEQRKKDEAERAAEEAVKAEEERLKKEEQERQEHEEYLKMKEMFSVDEEGETEQLGEEESQSLLQKFIDYIKEMKVVMLEDLAAHFQLKTQSCIERIQQLQAEGQLTGVIDDRGKFIYITMEELESVAKYIRQHGRVSISDLADSSNRLINLNPDNAEVQKKLFIGDNATELMDVEEVAA